tara:strand:+ start:2815 stop:3300 length:486 start_codon:yes stop_codon:yes gene_type:complete
MEQRIVVVEDGIDHIRDAEAYFKAIQNLKVDYATNYDEVFGLVCDKEQCRGRSEPGRMRFAPREDLTGVISDVFFPSFVGGPSTDPNGIRVALKLEAEKIPFVLNTSEYHHSDKVQWISDICQDRQWYMIDSSSDRWSNAEHKDWKTAWTVLQRIIAEKTS